MSVTQGAPAALAEPAHPVRRSRVGLLFGANLGLWMAFVTPVQVLLPAQISELGIQGKEAALGWVTALGALYLLYFLTDQVRLTDPDTDLGGYPTLYTLTAAVTLAGAVMVVRIRAVP